MSKKNSAPFEKSKVKPILESLDNNSEIYKQIPASNTKQRIIFLVMQFVLLSLLLWISTRLLNMFLTGLISTLAINIVISVYCFALVFWQLSFIIRMMSMKRSVLIDPQIPNKQRLVMATTIVPSREFELLRDKLLGMAAVKPYGNSLELWVLDEEDDSRVRLMVEEFNINYPTLRFRHFTRKHIQKYQQEANGNRFKRFQAKQKGGNINAWLDSISLENYDVVTFMDLDHIPEADFYAKVLPYFRDPKISFVQGPESFNNRNQNFISRAASFERDTFFGLLHRGYFGLGLPVIVGSHTTFRSTCLADLGGYYPVHLTEDYLIMLELNAAGHKGVYIDDILAVGELPTTWDAYLGQQYRWASGGLDLLFRYFPYKVRSLGFKKSLFTFVLLNYYAWGSFFLLSKLLIYICLLYFLSLQVSFGLIAIVIIFTVISTIGNYLWEKQFFIEPDKKKFLLENALMNNFIGLLLFSAMIKAVIKPNTSFNVTTKTGSQQSSRKNKLPYWLLTTFVLAMEIFTLCYVWFTSNIDNNSPGIWSIHNLLLYPLILSIVGNIIVLIFYRQISSNTDLNNIDLIEPTILHTPTENDALPNYRY